MADSITIVLDPGHGGENLGLNYNGFLEKDMNLTVAQYLKQELERYDAVEVYITNPSCEDMSLKARAQYAADMEADQLISLHFNMSENHEMFGSEVWIPSVGENYAWMHSLGDIVLEELGEFGLARRGVKTRLGKKGKDYYGIIRESVQRNIPAILIEHCYADYECDVAFLKSENSLHKLAEADARAIAKFYRLKSDELGVDYHDYVKNAYFVPEQAVASDETGPEEVKLSYVNENTFFIQVKETESELAYYDYSLDGGKTFSELYMWEYPKESLLFSVENLSENSKVIARVYNGHFVSTESNCIPFTGEKAVEGTEATTESKITQKENIKASGNFILLRTGVFLGSLITILLIALCVMQAFRQTGYLKEAFVKRIKKQLFLFGPIIAVCICITIGLQITLKSKLSDYAVTTAAIPLALQQENTIEKIVPVAKNESDVILEKEARLLTEQLPKKNMETMYDIARGYFQMETVEEMPRNQYHFDKLEINNGHYLYEDPENGVRAELGVDVSKFQGNVAWDQVKAAGAKFAMIRMGLRGYGSGELVMDDNFYVNQKNAEAAGLKTGIYFFSAAIDEAEAIEEADFVAKKLEGLNITMPVAFDTEPIYYDTARTDHLTPEKLTNITRAFCDRIAEYGYQPVIYANGKRLTSMLHLESLCDIPLWYADYLPTPVFPYDFMMWQYTEEGKIDGIDGNVDLNLYFIKDAS